MVDYEHILELRVGPITGLNCVIMLQLLLAYLAFVITWITIHVGDNE